MTPIQIIFILVAAVTLGAAVMVVSTRNIVHAALWLILNLFGIAVYFVILSAGFLAVAQVIIYIGAISILMIFAVMLTRRVAQDIGPQINSSWWLAALISALLFGGLAWLLSGWQKFNTVMPEFSTKTDSLLRLGQALVSPQAYIIPFEVASVLLVAALIGAIMVAWERS
jgi:NADH-quinone oxidoreductase subunit J